MQVIVHGGVSTWHRSSRVMITMNVHTTINHQSLYELFFKQYSFSISSLSMWKHHIKCFLPLHNVKILWVTTKSSNDIHYTFAHEVFACNVLCNKGTI